MQLQKCLKEKVMGFYIGRPTYSVLKKERGEEIWFHKIDGEQLKSFLLLSGWKLFIFVTSDSIKKIRVFVNYIDMSLPLDTLLKINNEIIVKTANIVEYAAAIP